MQITSISPVFASSGASSEKTSSEKTSSEKASSAVPEGVVLVLLVCATVFVPLLLVNWLGGLGVAGEREPNIH